jgi:cell division protein ZapA
LRTTFGEIGDMRLTVMAALLLADELAEARQRMRRIEEELLGLQHERLAAAGRTEALQADVAAAINAAAERIERLTRLLVEPVDGHRLALG